MIRRTRCTSTVIGLVSLVTVAFMPGATAAHAQFHGNGLVKNCIGPDGTTNYVQPGDIATITSKRSIWILSATPFDSPRSLTALRMAVGLPNPEVSPNLLAAPVDLVGLGSSTTVSYSFTGGVGRPASRRFGDPD